ncbi:MAG: laccase domain-containing protein [Synergistaceae bacterium]|jgi:copper oxidase (laccase) domain-containing protein|nr:laccase domain-containing protein [Synergistaceae bacterium]
MKGFVEEQAKGQRWLRFVSPEGKPAADVRFFMRGALLDGTKGNAASIRERLTPLLGAPFPMLAPRQVHGTRILDAAEDVIDTGSPAAEADGILLDVPGTEASLRFADCAPVVVAPLSGTTGTPWVLTMHSGYKGTVQNIVASGLEKVRGRYGASALSSACAWVGPCIGAANYPRDREEWTERGRVVFHAENVRIQAPGPELKPKVFFDIAGELKFQLLEAGIAEDRIFLSGVDAFARRDLCYSWRGGDREDRMFLWAGLPD